jgi:hypothetical protein
MAFKQSLTNILKRQGKSFYTVVKVSLINKYGVVIERNVVSDWNMNQVFLFTINIFFN